MKARIFIVLSCAMTFLAGCEATPTQEQIKGTHSDLNKESTGDHPTKAAVSQSERIVAPSKPREPLADLDEFVRKMLADGIIHSVDVNRCIVRVDPLIWIQMSLEAKQGMVQVFATYFGAKLGIGPTATKILSNRNDTKLGEYTWFGNIKIHQ